MGLALKLAPTARQRHPNLSDKVNFLKTAKINRLWIDLLSLQNKYYLPYDIDFLKRQQVLQHTSFAADFGSGPGHFVHALAKKNPDMMMYGFDRDPSFVSYAKSHSTELSNAHFLTNDIYAIKKHQFDLITLRMVVQQLSEQRKLLRTLQNNLKPQGYAYILEACDELTRLTPDVPSVKLLFLLLREHQTKKAGTGNFLPSFLGHAAKTELSLKSYQQIGISTTDHAQKTILAAILCHLAAVASHVMNVQIDLNNLVRDLDAWKHDPHSSGQLGVQQLLLKCE